MYQAGEKPILKSGGVKKWAVVAGIDLCGIGSADRFADAPEGYRPGDVLPGCRSVIALACRFNPGTLKTRVPGPYTNVRNHLSALMNDHAARLSYLIADEGYDAVPIGSIGPCDFNEKTGRYMGTISLKHAAVFAGLGKLGKNTLVVNDLYGNMIWLSAVLTTAELKEDPLASYEVCTSGCNVCVKSCPVKALDGVLMDQTACFEYAFGERNGGDWQIHCRACRESCPSCLGIRRRP